MLVRFVGHLRGWGKAQDHSSWTSGRGRTEGVGADLDSMTTAVGVIDNETTIRTSLGLREGDDGVIL